MSECTIIRPGGSFSGRQGLAYATGVSAESAGAHAICMHRLTLPPGARARAHLHEQHESSIYVISGHADFWSGPQLEHHVVVGPGDFLHIPAGVPHLPANTGSEPVEAVIARSDPNEQESVVTLPELDVLPHLPPLPDASAR
jgi:uncharacterized RmlC-like cupin family protein